MIAAILLILVTATATCHGQTQYYNVYLLYARPDCMGNPVQFYAENVTVDPTQCRNVGCSLLPLGARIRVCYNGTDPLSAIIPNNIVCPTCSYCGGDRYTGTACGSPGQIPFQTRRDVIGACRPSPSNGYYYILEGCTETGIDVFSNLYSDDRCTVLLSTRAPPSGAPCVPSSPLCTVATTTSTSTVCQYAMATRAPTGNTTNNQTSSGNRPVFGFIGFGTLGASLFLLAILFFVCI